MQASPGYPARLEFFSADDSVPEQGVSNYRIYNTLGLNPGIINDRLKNGAGEKVSPAVARKAFGFV